MLQHPAKEESSMNEPLWRTEAVVINMTVRWEERRRRRDDCCSVQSSSSKSRPVWLQLKVVQPTSPTTLSQIGYLK